MTLRLERAPSKIARASAWVRLVIGTGVSPIRRTRPTRARAVVIMVTPQLGRDTSFSKRVQVEFPAFRYRFVSFATRASWSAAEEISPCGDF